MLFYSPAEQHDAGAAEWEATWYMFWLIRLLNVGGSLISPSVSAARDREIRCLMSVYFYTTSQKKREKKILLRQCSVFQVKERFILTASSVRRLSQSYVACFSWSFTFIIWMLASKQTSQSHFEPWVSAFSNHHFISCQQFESRNK